MPQQTLPAGMHPPAQGSCPDPHSARAAPDQKVTPNSRTTAETNLRRDPQPLPLIRVLQCCERGSPHCEAIEWIAGRDSPQMQSVDVRRRRGCWDREARSRRRDGALRLQRISRPGANAGGGTGGVTGGTGGVAGSSGGGGIGGATGGTGGGTGGGTCTTAAAPTGVGCPAVCNGGCAGGTCTIQCGASACTNKIRTPGAVRSGDHQQRRLQDLDSSVADTLFASVSSTDCRCRAISARIRSWLWSRATRTPEKARLATRRRLASANIRH